MTDKKQRKNFSKKVKEEVFEEQDGCCANCGSFLIKGFHAHHKDADSSNDSKENCALFCDVCHTAKKGETSDLQSQAKVKALRDEKIQAIADYNMILERAEIGKFSGSHIDKAKDVVKEKISLAYSLYYEPDYAEPIPQDLSDALRANEAMIKFEGYVDGFKDGLQAKPNWDALKIEFQKEE